MKVIGITGGVGCGKSSVLQFLKEQYNAYVIETDKVAHQVMEPGQEVYCRVVEKFGEKILMPDGRIDRKILGAMVFGETDKKMLKQLNAITHPGVRKSIQESIRYIKENTDVSLIVVETALLQESGLEEYCDEIWYIYADEQTRIRRLMANRGYSLQHCMDMIKKQATEEYYIKKCNRRIDNSKEKAYTQQQIQKALEF